MSGNADFQHVINYYETLIVLLKRVDDNFVDDEKYLKFSIAAVHDMIKPLQDLEEKLKKQLSS